MTNGSRFQIIGNRSWLELVRVNIKSRYLDDLASIKTLVTNKSKATDTQMIQTMYKTKYLQNMFIRAGKM